MPRCRTKGCTFPGGSIEEIEKHEQEVHGASKRRKPKKQAHQGEIKGYSAMKIVHGDMSDRSERWRQTRKFKVKNPDGVADSREGRLRNSKNGGQT